MTESFYWHDYETSGTDPALDRPMQFAGVRTDEALNIIGEPLTIYCRLAPDVLPHPAACAVTGLNPNQVNKLGLSEREFAAKIHAQMAQEETCSAGYNSIRFDDEFTRHMLYRNFYDAYEREWQQGNSRWDLIDVVRLCCALRPDGISWPEADGVPIFKLEKLTEANGIAHVDAHDAMADVEATIALARLLREQKPRLFEYALALRDKNRVAETIGPYLQEPVVHVSGKLPNRNFCTSLFLPVARHPANKNSVICVDLRHDPGPLLEWSAADISTALYTPAANRPADAPAIPLKQILLNRCPIVATQKLLDQDAAERIDLNVDECMRNAERLRGTRSWLNKLTEIFSDFSSATARDVDAQLYGGGFFSNKDKTLMREVRECSADELAQQNFSFEDGRLTELLWRYRARNFPESLSTSERQAWAEHCYTRLNEGPGFGFADFEQALQEASHSGLNGSLREQLANYGREQLANLELAGG